MKFEDKLREAARSHDMPTAQARNIFRNLLPDWAELFLRKNEGYGKVDDHLGAKGVFPDVNRKVGKLERAIWDGLPLPEGSEPVEEVIADLIGHLFLMWHMLSPSPDSEEDFDLDPGPGQPEYRESDQAVFATLSAKGHDYWWVTTSVQDTEPEGAGTGWHDVLASPIEMKLLKTSPRGATFIWRFKEGRAPDGATVNIGCPDPQMHSDGWAMLPDDVRSALRSLATGQRVIDRDRNAVRDLMGAHEG